MTSGEKIAKLRKEKNYTQEQFADLLGVSRQSVSKWESDIAFPETEKLIKIAEMFDVSIDYLLKESEENIVHTEVKNDSIFSFHYEYKSKRMIGKKPLVHINIGLREKANGFIAIGLRSKGVISIGVFSMGLLSIGLFSLGLIALGNFSLGLLALGAIALGIISIGAIAVGLFSIGAIAIGLFARGAIAVGYYFAYGEMAYSHMIALGAKEAVGGVYSSASGVQNLYIYDKATVLDLIKTNIKHFKLFVSMIKGMI